MPVVKMTSRIDRTVKIKVLITEPSGKTHTYDFDAPLKPVENMSAQFPWWGSEKRDHFTAVGTWRFDILDEEDHVVISAPLEIVPLEDICIYLGSTKLPVFQSSITSPLPMYVLFGRCTQGYLPCGDQE